MALWLPFALPRLDSPGTAVNLLSPETNRGTKPFLHLGVGWGIHPVLGLAVARGPGGLIFFKSLPVGEGAPFFFWGGPAKFLGGAKNGR